MLVIWQLAVWLLQTFSWINLIISFHQDLLTNTDVVGELEASWPSSSPALYQFSHLS